MTVLISDWFNTLGYMVICLIGKRDYKNRLMPKHSMNGKSEVEQTSPT